MEMCADLHVWHSTLDVDPQLVTELAACLSEQERERAARFHFERDRRRFLVARSVLRSILGSRLGIRPEQVGFRYGDYGKPFLSSDFEQSLFFNVAHSQDHAVFVVAEGVEVGVDIEAMRPVDDAMTIADRFFSSKERSILRALPRSTRLFGFFECWTRKEAYVKALGEGLSHPLDAFDVPIGAGTPGEPRTFRDTPGVGWSLHDISAWPSYAAAVVVRGWPRGVHVHAWSPKP